MTPRKRGYLLTGNGKHLFLSALTLRGWSQTALSTYSGLSRSTVGRFVRGKAVDYYSVQVMLKELGLEIRDCIIQPSPTFSTLTEEYAPALIPDTLKAFFMNAQYDPNKGLKIQCLLDALENCLVDSDVIIQEHRGQLSVVGVFEPECQADIEAVLCHLEKLCDRCTLTWSNKTECFPATPRPVKHS